MPENIPPTIAVIPEQMKELYGAIGKFIYTFSNLEFNIRNLLGTILNLDEDRFYVVTSPYDFATLCNVTKTLLEGISAKELPDKSGLKATFSRCLEVNTERVRIAHGTWILSMGAQHVSRNTFQPKMYFESTEKIESLTVEADALFVEMDRLVTIITANRLDD